MEPSQEEKKKPVMFYDADNEEDREIERKRNEVKLPPEPIDLDEISTEISWKTPSFVV